MKTTKRIVMMTLAGVVGLGGAAVTALAQGDELVTLCFRNRTIQVPAYLVNRYLAVIGTTAGPCVVTGP